VVNTLIVTEKTAKYVFEIARRFLFLKSRMDRGTCTRHGKGF